jgi:hypothetical protein
VTARRHSNPFLRLVFGRRDTCRGCRTFFFANRDCATHSRWPSQFDQVERWRRRVVERLAIMSPWHTPVGRIDFSTSLLLSS